MIFNSHTHIGDAFLKAPHGMTIEQLVAPPHGYKHRMLSSASREEIISGMKKAIGVMEKCGTDVFIDFREGGVDGIEMLLEAMEGRKIRAIIMGRPSSMKYNEKGMERILSMADGIGLSSISDWDYGEMEAISHHVREAGKMFALHVSEARREDIGMVLDLKPDFIVHLCYATEEDISEVVSRGIGVVVCPRANAFFGLSPPLKILLEKKAKVMLGTDNAMLVAPDIREEARYVINNFGVEEREAFKMISKTPSDFFGEILKNHEHS
ncbi:MAG: amidohydrolase family protein [Thermoplasmata archaeon]|nr:amidohydrolase family protein [Thermoplasmata archaeon]